MPPKSDPTTSERRRELERAQREYESTVCAWFVFLVFALLCITIFFLPFYPAHGYGGVGYHHGGYYDDDDHGSWKYYSDNDDDDDDDDDNSHHHHATLASPHVFAEHLDPSMPTLPVMPHKDVMHGDYMGKHVKTVGCASDSDAIELRAAADVSLTSLAHDDLAQWPRIVKPPKARVEFDEQRGTVRFAIDAPYFSQNAAYVAAFEAHDEKTNNLLRTPQTCQSAPALADKHTDADVWAHSPNAMYAHNALPREVTHRGGAYATANGWQVSATNCARVSYTWEANATTLDSCHDSKNNDLLHFKRVSDTLTSVSGTLWLNLLWPCEKDKQVHVLRWPFSFALYVDTYESKMSVVDIPFAEQKVAYTPNRNVNEFREKVALAQKLVASASERKGEDARIDMQLQSLQWHTFSTLVNAWFEPELDGRFVQLDPSAKTSAQRNQRALRLQLRTTTTANAGALLQHLLSANEHKAATKLALQQQQKGVTEHVEREAALLTPIYDVIGFAPSFKGAVDTQNYGHFALAEADFIDNETSKRAVCRMHGSEIECHRTWLVVLQPKTPELYQDSFEVRMCDRNSPEACSVVTPAHRVSVDVAITDPSLAVEDVKQMQIEISSQLNRNAMRQLGEDDPRRVCMQSYAVGPSALMQSIDLRTVAAWLCVANKPGSDERPAAPKQHKVHVEDQGQQAYLHSLAKAKTGCASKRHYIQLLGNNTDVRQAQRYDVIVHEPGSYGTWSTTVCFNASSIFVDNSGSSVHRTEQFFQSEVVAVPTEKRRNEQSGQHPHRTFASFAAIDTSDSSTSAHHGESVQLALSPHLKTLTSPALGEALQRMEVPRFSTASYDVQPLTERERRLHNMHEHTTLTVLLIIGVVILCLALCAFICCFQYRRRFLFTDTEAAPEKTLKPSKTLFLTHSESDTESY